MSKRKQSKNISFRTSGDKPSIAGRSRKRGRMVVTIFGLAILIAVVFIWYGMGSKTAISGQPDPAANQVAAVSEEITPPATAPNTETMPPTTSAVQNSPDAVPATTLATKTASQSNTPPTKLGPVVQYPELIHDFGTIAQGTSVTHTFIVKNIGDEPLKLIKAKGS